MLRRSLRGMVALLVVFAVLTAGCAKSKQKDTPPPQGPPKEITLYLLGDAPLFTDLILEFERKHPHVKVHVTVPESGAIATPDELDGYDILYGSTRDLQRKQGAGGLLDLTALPVPAWDPLVADLVERHAWIDGKRGWVPISLSATVLNISSTDLEKAGLSLPDWDWTYADLEQLLQALVDAGSPGKFFNAISFRHEVVRSFGGRDYDPATLEWRFDTPENLQAYEYLRGLVEKGLLFAEYRQPTLEERGYPLGTLFPPVQLSQGGPDDGTRHLLPMPVGPAGRRGMITGQGLMVSRGAQHREEVFAFLQFMLTPEAQQRMASAGIRPVIADETALKNWRGTVGENAAKVLELSLAGGVVPEQPMDVSLAAELYGMLNGLASIEETLADLDYRLNE